MGWNMVVRLARYVWLASVLVVLFARPVQSADPPVSDMTSRAAAIALCARSDDCVSPSNEFAKKRCEARRSSGPTNQVIRVRALEPFFTEYSFDEGRFELRAGSLTDPSKELWVQLFWSRKQGDRPALASGGKCRSFDGPCFRYDIADHAAAERLQADAKAGKYFVELEVEVEGTTIFPPGGFTAKGTCEVRIAGLRSAVLKTASGKLVRSLLSEGLSPVKAKPE